MMKATNTSETVVNFYNTRITTTHKTTILIPAAMTTSNPTQSALCLNAHKFFMGT
jgi:hypothetical protein